MGAVGSGVGYVLARVRLEVGALHRQGREVADPKSLLPGLYPLLWLGRALLPSGVRVPWFISSTSCAQVMAVWLCSPPPFPRRGVFWVQPAGVRAPCLIARHDHSFHSVPGLSV